MRKGVDLLLAHCACLEERRPARERLQAVLGKELTGFLLAALRPGPAARGQPRRGRLTSSSPYSRT